MSSEGGVTKGWLLKPWLANKINGQLWGSSATFSCLHFYLLAFFLCLWLFSEAAAAHMSQRLFLSWWVQGETGSSAEINEASWVLETFCAHYIGVLPRLEHFTLQSNSEVAPVNKQGTATNAAEYLKALQVATSSLMRPPCRLGEDEWSFAAMSTKRFQPSCHLCFSHFQWKSALECSYKKIVGINWIY